MVAGEGVRAEDVAEVVPPLRLDGAGGALVRCVEGGHAEVADGAADRDDEQPRVGVPHGQRVRIEEVRAPAVGLGAELDLDGAW